MLSKWLEPKSEFDSISGLRGLNNEHSDFLTEGNTVLSGQLPTFQVKNYSMKSGTSC
jgi:hypothetical protein